MAGAIRAAVVNEHRAKRRIVRIVNAFQFLKAECARQFLASLPAVIRGRVTIDNATRDQRLLHCLPAMRLRPGMRPLLRETGGADQFHVDARIDFRERMHDGLTPVAVKDASRGDAAVGVAVIETRSGFDQAFGVQTCCRGDRDKGREKELAHCALFRSKRSASTSEIFVSLCAVLYVVATPIGNLNDITLRALATLSAVDLIAAEDTRHSGNLLRHFEIQKPLVSYHEHNEAMRTAQLIQRLEAGENIALLTDAGTPALSDPGARLISACIERNLPFTMLPGASAILVALLGSGFPADQFLYAGFLPPKSGRRERELRAAAGRDISTLFFESPHRLLKTLTACAGIMPERKLCVARELTKKFEEFRRGTAAELLAHYTAHPAKGEITLVVSGDN